MPEAGEGGSRNLNIVAIIAIVVLVLIALIALANRKPSDQVRQTTTETTRQGEDGKADVDVKVDVPDVDLPDSVTIKAE